MLRGDRDRGPDERKLRDALPRIRSKRVDVIRSRDDIELRAAVHDHIRACGTDLISPVVIDISAVRSVDATALKVIAAASRQAQRYGVRVVLRGARPAVRRMLHLTHLIRLIELEREPIPA